MLTDVLAQNSIFLNEVLDHLPLPLIQPARNGNNEKRKWIQTRSHRGRLSCGRKFHASSDIDRVSGQFQVTPQSRLIAYTADNGDKLLDIAMEQSAGMGPPMTRSRLHFRNEGVGFVRFTHEAS